MEIGAFVFVALTLAAGTGVPRGWMLAGSEAAEYQTSVDRETVHEGQPATGIAFGILLTGSGRVWLSGTKLEVITLETQTTTAARPAPPVNLDFTENRRTEPEYRPANQRE